MFNSNNSEFRAWFRLGVEILCSQFFLVVRVSPLIEILAFSTSVWEATYNCGETLSSFRFENCVSMTWPQSGTSISLRIVTPSVKIKMEVL